NGQLARAWLAVDALELNEAARLIASIDVDALRGHVLPGLVVYVEALRLLYSGRPEEALHELLRFAPSQRPVRDELALQAARSNALHADLLLALGRGNHARAVIQRSDHPLMRVPLARMLLLSGEPTAAVGVASDFDWVQVATPRSTVEMLLVKAVAHHRNGQPETARATLGNAIGTAANADELRPFADFPRAELIEIAQGLRAPAMAFLERATGAVDGPVFRARVELVHLTSREQLILTRLAAGLRARQIATELFISYNTVRTYIRQIYKKLSATSRDDAVTRARAYGLIPTSPRSQR
ncbi:MAG TPA: LuxR C-terminal-related transcriptional regulator, partial [Jatrophihabitans sp.]|nr:LuxR C-terminal-related transcriptional regulator [Jatrophihabitans sp.]